jgi:hypothetical protein
MVKKGRILLIFEVSLPKKESGRDTCVISLADYLGQQLHIAITCESAAEHPWFRPRCPEMRVAGRWNNQGISFGF